MYIHNEDPKDLAIYMQNFCGGTSLMNLKLWSQILMARKARPYSYDYGEKKNFEVYGSSTPPQIKMKNIRCKLGLLYGIHDNILMKKDIETSLSEIPKDKIVFLKDNYNQDHSGFAVSKDQSHMQDIIDLFKKHPIQ